MPLDANNGLSTSDATWLAAILASGVPLVSLVQNNVEFCNRLQQVSLGDLILAAAAVAPAAARTGVIELYRAWIASQGPGTPHLLAAWYNLGAALSNTGDIPGAMLAFRNVLMLSPQF